MPPLPTKDRLLPAAWACISTHGVGATTEQIGQQAGSSPGTLFRHYPTRAALLQAAFQQAERVLFYPGQDLLGDTLHDQLFALWARVSEQALLHPDAFTFWRLLRSTPLAASWLPPHPQRYGQELYLGPFAAVPLLLGRATHQPQRYGLADAWRLVTHWLGSVQFASAVLSGELAYPGLPDPQQWVDASFVHYWQGLDLPWDTPAEPSAYA